MTKEWWVLTSSFATVQVLVSDLKIHQIYKNQCLLILQVPENSHTLTPPSQPPWKFCLRSWQVSNTQIFFLVVFHHTVMYIVVFLLIFCHFRTFHKSGWWSWLIYGKHPSSQWIQWLVWFSKKHSLASKPTISLHR